MAVRIAVAPLPVLEIKNHYSTANGDGKAFKASLSGLQPPKLFEAEVSVGVTTTAAAGGDNIVGCVLPTANEHRPLRASGMHEHDA